MRTNHTTNDERAQVHRDDGKVIGGLVGNVFRKHVDASRHFLRKPYPAIAFDLDTLAQAKEQGARFVEVIDRESGKTYRASLERVWSKGFPVNRNHGEQIALALGEWNQGDDELPAEQLSFEWGAP